MEYKNAFVGKKEQPTVAELDAALAATAPLWHDLINWIATEHAVVDIEWKSSATKYGWSIRLKLKRRNIVYMSPADGCFLVSFVLGDRAIAATKETPFPAAVRKAISEAPKYAEGREFACSSAQKAIYRQSGNSRRSNWRTDPTCRGSPSMRCPLPTL
jgi:hypothetical protein